MGSAASRYDATTLISPQLEFILPSEVPASRDTCGICLYPYVAPAQDSSLEEQREGQENICHKPRRLPCGHIFGHDCVTTALLQGQRRSSCCPLCRHLFRVRRTPTGNFQDLVITALYDEFRMSDHPFFTPAEQDLRYLYFIILMPVFVAVTLVMDVGPWNDPQNRFRKASLFEKVCCLMKIVFLLPVTEPPRWTHIIFTFWQNMRASLRGNLVPDVRPPAPAPRRSTAGNWQAIVDTRGVIIDFIWNERVSTEARQATPGDEPSLPTVQPQPVVFRQPTAGDRQVVGDQRGRIIGHVWEDGAFRAIRQATPSNDPSLPNVQLPAAVPRQPTARDRQAVRDQRGPIMGHVWENGAFRAVRQATPRVEPSLREQRERENSIAAETAAREATERTIRIMLMRDHAERNEQSRNAEPNPLLMPLAVVDSYLESEGNMQQPPDGTPDSDLNTNSPLDSVEDADN